MKKWFHAIGASGKTTANVARMFKTMGWFVTGSDSQFIPPASDIIQKSEVPFDLGYSYKHLTKQFWEEKLKTSLDIPEHPDLGLVVESVTPKNKELLFAKKHNINIIPFSQILGEHLIKPNSIVIAGTAGKTTTTAILVHMLINLGLNPSYMIGADVVDLDESLVKTESAWSVIEGDEYHNPQLSRGAKFLEYKPKYLVLTKISWEHHDVFETEARYVEEFKKLVELVPESGLIVAKSGDKNIDEVLKSAKCRVIRYKQTEKNFQNSDGLWRVEGGIGDIKTIFDDKDNKILEFNTKLIGDYNLENILAAVALVYNVIPVEDIKILTKTIEDFKGAKKRLEFVYESDDLIVVDDFGVAPERARNSLKTLKQHFPSHHIVGVYEPNAGSRPMDQDLFNQMYDHAFNNVHKLIIPTLSDINSELADSKLMVERLASFGVDVEHLENEKINEYLAEYISQKSKEDEKVLVVFFSSYRLTTIAQELGKSF
jgi:UDP-N-acetylmuramate: L-alanyl-gamma-D-glutamyl-meso-diaminopimelate ligase